VSAQDLADGGGHDPVPESASSPWILTTSSGGSPGELPILRGTVRRVLVDHLPDGRKPRKTMWLWHAGPAPLSIDELWRACLARFDEEHTFRFLKGALGLTAAKVRTPAQASRWVRLVMAAHAQLLLARPDTADLRRPWQKTT
jgi:hypothetical protein